MVSAGHLLRSVKEFLGLLIDLSQKRGQELAWSLDEVVRGEVECLITAPTVPLLTALLLPPPLPPPQAPALPLLIAVCLTGVAFIVTHCLFLFLLLILEWLVPQSASLLLLDALLEQGPSGRYRLALFLQTER